MPNYNRLDNSRRIDRALAGVEEARQPLDWRKIGTGLGAALVAGAEGEVPQQAWNIIYPDLESTPYEKAFQAEAGRRQAEQMFSVPNVPFSLKDVNVPEGFEIAGYYSDGSPMIRKVGFDTRNIDVPENYEIYGFYKDGSPKIRKEKVPTITDIKTIGQFIEEEKPTGWQSFLSKLQHLIPGTQPSEKKVQEYRNTKEQISELRKKMILKYKISEVKPDDIPQEDWDAATQEQRKALLRYRGLI